MDWQPFILSFQLAVLTTFLLLGISIPIAWKLSRSKSAYGAVAEAIVTLPLVLPPSVIGFYLLIWLSPNSLIGGWVESTIGIRLVFSFPGLVIASLIYSLPFMVHPLLSGFRSLSPAYAETASTLGKTQRQILWRVVLPNVKPAILTGCVLTFAHTIGEFGVALMIGGNIPGQTRIASIAIYEEVERMNYSRAHLHSLALIGISLAVLITVYVINHHNRRRAT